MRFSFLFINRVVFIGEQGDRTKRAATPRAALEQLRRSQVRQVDDLRAETEEAMLTACGELGYRNVSVQGVLERSGCSRVRFYRLFESKADCYAKAYAAGAGRLCDAMLGAAAEGDSWGAGLRAALAELTRFVTERAALAKGLLVEVHIAGEPAIAKRTEMIERLTRAVDSARRENESRHSPPPITAEFMVCAIEESVVTALARGRLEDFAAAVPELVLLTVAPYFGDLAAREEAGAVRAV